MTLKELSQLYHLRLEIAEDRSRLALLRSKAYTASSPNVSGAPGGKGGDRVSRYGTEIAQIEKLIEDKLARCLAEQYRLEEYISTIPDSLTRQIFTHRFIGHLSWAAVAMRVGGGSTADGVKKICYRYIENSEQK